MAWDFETEPEFQKSLDWADEFVRREVEPLDLAFRDAGAPYDRKNPIYKKITDPLKAEVRKHGLWACHLGPDGREAGVEAVPALRGALATRLPPRASRRRAGALRERARARGRKPVKLSSG